MKNLVKFSYFLLLLIVGVHIFPFWGVVLAVWIGIYSYIKWRKLDQFLTRREFVLFNVTALLYPLVETTIKYAITYNWIPYSWEWLNRLEHFGFSVFLGVLIFPIIKKSLGKVDLTSQYLIFVGAIVILGNFNEFAEYLMRVAFSLQSKFAIYYWDTILDLFVNYIGASCGFLLVKSIKLLPIRHEQSRSTN